MVQIQPDPNGELRRALEQMRRTGERIEVSEGGRRIAAIVWAEDLEVLERLEDEADVRAAEEALAEGGEAIPYEEFRKELDLDD